MGVCGYTYREAQEMPIDALARAINARNKHDVAPWNELFKMFGGEAEPTMPTKQAHRPFDMGLFDALFP